MEKKTKLTISGSAKKSIKNIEIAKTHRKNSVVIEKQPHKTSNKSGGVAFKSGFKSKTTSAFKRSNITKPPISNRSSLISNDFEKRKLAEQRATKRLKSDFETKDIKNLKKTKNLLENSIAIPIWLKKKILDYKLIGIEIKKSLRKVS